MSVLKELFEKTGKISEGLVTEEIAFNNVIGFISLRNGAGAATVLSNVAYLLAEDNSRTCIVDLSFFMPNLYTFYNKKITKDKSFINYFNSGRPIPEVLNQINDNLWLISMSFATKPYESGFIDEHSIKNAIKELKKTFDFVLLYMPYEPLQEFFIDALALVDRGYIVWDEQIDCAPKTNQMIDWVYKMSSSTVANKINNIILNKRTERGYPEEVISKIQCDLITELPFDKEIPETKNNGTVYFEAGTPKKAYQEGIIKLISHMMQM